MRSSGRVAAMQVNRSTMRLQLRLGTAAHAVTTELCRALLFCVTHLPWTLFLWQELFLSTVVSVGAAGPLTALVTTESGPEDLPPPPQCTRSRLNLVSGTWF